MQDEVMFVHPMRRRWWLLSKALENAPLDDALKIAQAVDQFLVSGEANTCDRHSDARYFDRAADPETPANPPSEEEPAPAPNAPVDATDEKGCGERRPFAGGPDGALTNHTDKIEWRPCQSTEIDNATSNGESDLAVWASIEDVVRYLRQRDDVVVPQGDGQFLVNGRFSEDINGLITRANRVRERQRKPPFQLMPAGFTVP